MGGSEAARSARDRLVRVGPIVRGLLAERTESADVPYRPVVMACSASEAALEFAASAEPPQLREWPEGMQKTDEPPLLVGPVDCDGSPEKTRQELRAAIEHYRAQHGSAPRTVCVRRVGMFQVRGTAADGDGALEGKTALVTGAAGAIGYGVCLGLLENGCRVAATDLPGERLERLAGELDALAPGRVIGPALDVTDGESVARGFEAAIEAWGGIDVVVVNAGIALVSKLVDMNLEAFRRVERVNVEGALLTLAEAGRLFMRQGTGGDIIVMSTKNVPAPGAGFGAYSATKAACHQLGRIASLEMAPYGVRVNMVAPDAVFGEGSYKSGLWQEVGPDRMRARGLDEKGLQEYYRERNLLKARVTERHVANAVVFFATRQTPTTGATIPVDGGLPDATPR